MLEKDILKRIFENYVLKECFKRYPGKECFEEDFYEDTNFSVPVGHLQF